MVGTSGDVHLSQAQGILPQMYDPVVKEEELVVTRHRSVDVIRRASSFQKETPLMIRAGSPALLRTCHMCIPQERLASSAGRVNDTPTKAVQEEEINGT